MKVERVLPQVWQIDNFLTDYETVRHAGINAEYIDWPGPDGQVYKRICMTQPKEVIERLDEIFGVVEIKGMAFRLNYEGEPPNQSIHSDMGWGTHALVLYLNDGPSGTAFWHHHKSGASNILPGDVDLFEQIKDDFDNVRAWDQRAFVKMKHNRAVIYEGDFFHSRYPFEAFGSTPEDGRLILVAFFTPVGG